MHIIRDLCTNILVYRFLTLFKKSTSIHLFSSLGKKTPIFWKMNTIMFFIHFLYQEIVMNLCILMVSYMIKCKGFWIRFTVNYDSCLVVIHWHTWLTSTVIVIGVWGTDSDKHFDGITLTVFYRKFQFTLRACTCITIYLEDVKNWHNVQKIFFQNTVWRIIQNSIIHVKGENSQKTISCYLHQTKK